MNEQNDKFELRTELDAIACKDGFWTVQKHDGIITLFEATPKHSRKSFARAVVFYAAIAFIRFCADRIEREDFKQWLGVLNVDAARKRFEANEQFREAFWKENERFDLLGFDQAALDAALNDPGIAPLLSAELPGFHVEWFDYARFDMTEEPTKIENDAATLEVARPSRSASDDAPAIQPPAGE